MSREQRVQRPASAAIAVSSHGVALPLRLPTPYIQPRTIPYRVRRSAP